MEFQSGKNERPEEPMLLDGGKFAGSHHTDLTGKNTGFVQFALKPKHLGAAPWARFPHPCPCQEDNEPREKGKGGGKGKNRGGKGGPKGKDVAWPARWGSMSAIPTARS